MEPLIDVIGMGADGPAGLRAELRERIHRADFLAGGERHLRHFPEARGRRFVIRENIDELVQELRERPSGRCVVLASGDPLFYGIGRSLVGRVPGLRFEPALSSMQLAFARFGLPWQDAALASVHGRDVRASLLPLLGESLVGLFTRDGDSPAEVARFLLPFLPPDDRRVAFVGEDLGSDAERLTGPIDLRELAERRFRPLNYLILHRVSDRRAEAGRWRGLVPGVPDTAFRRPAEGPEMMTRQEVRAAVLARLLGSTEAGDVVWDIGAGLGTVAVEVAVLRPHVEVLAVEKDLARADLLQQNRARFDALNVRLRRGTAPEALAHEERRPRYVFIGGSGGRLPEVLDHVAERLIPGGRLVASFVILEHLALTLDRIRAWGWPVEVSEISVSRGDSLAGLTGLQPHRAVFLVSADKPGAGHA